MEIVKKDSDYLNIKYNEISLMLVDKPLKWTSFDVVNKIRYKLKHFYGVKKLKVGHAGTLDPLATGLLIICTGKGTKRIDEFQGQKKTYTGALKLGAITESYDAEKPEMDLKDYDHLTEDQIKAALMSFQGEIEQFPPMFSALKVDGQALYKWARKGVSKEIKSRKVTFYSIELVKIELPFVYFCVECSKGTYIRSFAHDVGEKLGVGAYLTELRRTAIGDFQVDDAIELLDWANLFPDKEKI